MRGVSSRMAANPRRISSSESNFWSMRTCNAAESAKFFTSAQAVSRWRERSRELMESAPVRSPAAAEAAARSNWSVTLAIALTTTTGCLPCATRPATMAAVRPMAAGSSTEVPPNFMTTRLMRRFSSRIGRVRRAPRPRQRLATPATKTCRRGPRVQTCLNWRAVRRSGWPRRPHREWCCARAR